MFIDNLKKSILLKAIQGKLVEQNQNDEPASELLKRIREEKEKLIKDGKIKKEKSLTSITDEEKPFDIPSSWEWIRVKDVCYFGNGEKVSGKKYPYLEARYLRGKDVGKIYSEGNFVEKGNRLILVDGENSGEIFDLNEDGYLGSTFKIFNTYKSINADYLQKFLTFRKDEFRNNKTGAAIPHLNKDLFFNYPFPLPPLEEQKRIVDKLDELMPLLDEARPLEEEITKLEKDFPSKLRQSILQYAIQGKLVEQNSGDEPASELLKKIKEEKERLVKEGKIKKEKPLEPITDEEKLFDIPSNWEWARLGEVFEFNPKVSVDNDEQIIGFSPMTLLKDGYRDEITFEEKKRKEVKKNFTHFENGDIVIAKITPCFQNKKSAIIKDCPSGVGAGTTELHVLRCIYGIDKKYGLWFLKNPLLIKDCEQQMTGTAGQQRVGTETLRNYLFPIPPLKEQIRIVAKLDELMKLCDELEEQIG